MKLRNKASAVGLVSMVMLGMGAMPALAAEGSFNTYMTQVQPSFDSRQWTDKNTTSASTTITLSSCKLNAAGKAPGTTALRSVSIGLFRVGDNVPIRTMSRACGTYDFGRLSSGTYIFRIMSINGYTTPNRSIFLNANPVYVSY